MPTKTAVNPQNKKDDNELPYSLYEVSHSDENKHAATTFLHCTNKRTFSVGETGYCDSGELLLAEWRGEQLCALYKANVVGDKVKIGRCIKGGGNASEISLSQVTDHR